MTDSNRPISYYRRCKGAGYNLQVQGYPVDSRRTCWRVWFEPTPREMLTLVCLVGEGMTRESACRDLWGLLERARNQKERGEQDGQAE
jgi:hypothetical protein